MPSPKPTFESDTDESNSYTISQLLLKFTQHELIPRVFVLEELTSHLDGEFTTEQNQLVLYSNPDQTSPINTMFESFIHVSSSKQVLVLKYQNLKQWISHQFKPYPF